MASQFSTAASFFVAFLQQIMLLLNTAPYFVNAFWVGVPVYVYCYYVSKARCVPFGMALYSFDNREHYLINNNKLKCCYNRHPFSLSLCQYFV